MAKQKELNNNIGNYGWVRGVTQYESNFLPSVSGGTKELDSGFDNIYGYEDYLEPIVQKSRAAFNKAISKQISADDLKKINDGLEGYVKSSKDNSKNLKILKASVLKAFGSDMLTTIYENCDAGVKQIVPASYFEDLAKYLKVPEDQLIDPQSIRKYQKKAIQVTIKYFSMFLKKMGDEELSIDQTAIYRGQGNYKYYDNAFRGSTADILSTYGAIPESTEFFERQIFNSYSINRRLAEHFMVMGGNRRRVMLVAEFSAIIPNLFSSFFVCDLFKERQFELLTLPNSKRIYITERLHTKIMTEFNLTENPIKGHEQPVPTQKEIFNIADKEED